MTWYGVISSINMDTVILHILSGKKVSAARAVDGYYVFGVQQSQQCTCT